MLIRSETMSVRSAHAGNTPGGVDGTYARLADRPAAGPAWRVLLADDNGALRHSTSQILTRTGGCQVTATANGLEAWEALGTGDFDIVVTDLEMPYLSGLELIQRMRLSHLDLPAILITANAAGWNQTLTRQWDIAAWLEKPFPMAELNRLIHHILESQRKPTPVAVPA